MCKNTNIELNNRHGQKGEDEDRLSMLTDNVFTVRLVRVDFTPLFLALYSVKQLILELLRI